MPQDYTAGPAGPQADRASSPAYTAPGDPDPNLYSPGTAAYADEQGFLQWLYGFYGRDPFVVSGDSQLYPGADRHGSTDPAIPNVFNTNNIPFIQAIVSAFGGEITPDELTSIVNNRTAETAYNAGKTTGLNRWLKANAAGLSGAANIPGYIEETALAKFGFTPLSFREWQLGNELESKFKSDHQTTYDLWKKYFGNEATMAQINQVEAAGKDAAQWEAYIRSLPSHLSGINIGQYTDTKALADVTSQKYFNHPSSDGNIQDLVNLGYGTQSDVLAYYEGIGIQPGRDIAPVEYNHMYKSAEDYTRGVWNDVPNPNDLFHVWQQQGSPGALGNGGTPPPTTATTPAADVAQPKLSVLENAPP